MNTEKKQYVLICCQDELGQIVFINKDRPEDQKGKINLPGGKVEDGENAMEAAIRELKEETGIDNGWFEWQGRYEFDSGIMTCVHVKIKHQDLKPRDGETEVPFWSKLDEVKDLPNLMPNLPKLIPLIIESIEPFHLHHHEFMAI